MTSTKTPEQMAEEYVDGNSGGECSDDTGGLRAAFLAGYQAAKDQLQPQPFHKGADVYIIDANNPLPKPMPLSIAEQYQFADTSKVMNSPEKLDSCEHILDMKQMVDVNFSNNSNGWISVKDRLPEIAERVLVLVVDEIHISSLEQETSEYEYCQNDLITFWDGDWDWPDVTHWMVLPKPPKDE